MTDKIRNPIEAAKLQKLEKKYSDYVVLIDEVVSEVLKEIEEKAKQEYAVAKRENCQYLIFFQRKLDWLISTKRIKGEPDSFTIAACLLYSLLEKKRVYYDLNKVAEMEENPSNKKLMFINYEIAFRCALKVASEPITYYQTSDNQWHKESHPKVNLTIPKGMIKGGNLFNRIVYTLAINDLKDGDESIMILAHLLHLLYLNCQ